ncbi:MAG: ATP-binding protein [Bacteroidota bacterium]|nr:ATP-binding protein [Bacteroidota bacterium]
MINRLNADRITVLMKQFPSVALIGPRQCGKTTMAKLFKKNNKKNTIYFDLESPLDRQKFYDPQLLLEELENDCVIIDEVQRMPELFALLRYLIDRKKKPGRFLLLGSASPDLIKDASETLAGRIYYIDVAPFNLTELPQKNNTLQKHWYRGGFPDSFLAKNDTLQQNWINGFVRTFIERDLNQLFGVNFSTDLMMRLWRMLAHHHGGIWNAHSFAKGLDVSPVTVNRYLDYLSGAFMVRKLPAYHFNSKKSLVKAPKVYIRDSGIVNYLLNINRASDLKYHPAIGNLWEGYAIEQILELLPPTIQAYFYRTHDGSEMDLVLVKGITPFVCIEIKNSSTPTISRGLTESLLELKTKNNYIVVPGHDVDYLLKKEIRVVSLTTFLGKYIKTIK